MLTQKLKEAEAKGETKKAEAIKNAIKDTKKKKEESKEGSPIKYLAAKASKPVEFVKLKTYNSFKKDKKETSSKTEQKTDEKQKNDEEVKNKTETSNVVKKKDGSNLSAEMTSMKVVVERGMER